MSVLAITGVSGYLGQGLVKKLSRESKYEKVIGIDIKEPKIKSGYQFYNLDVRNSGLIDLFNEQKVTQVVHLAYIVNPTKKPDFEYDVDVNGTKNVLEACKRGKVKKLIIASSIAAYGWFPDNPIPISESNPLRGNNEFSYSKNKVIVESLINDFQKNNPECDIIVLRICNVIGPNVRNAISFALEAPIFFGVSGFDPFVAFTHEEDMTEILYQSVIRSIRGIFNVSGDGMIRLSEMLKVANKKVVYLPEKLLRIILNFLFTLNIIPFGGDQLVFMKHSCIPSISKLKNDFGYTSRYSTIETLKEFKVKRLKK